MFKNYTSNNPGIATKVMNVLKGFRTIDKIIPMAADEAITAGMICQATADTTGADGVVTLAKGYDTAVAVPYFAFNNYFDDDAQSVKYSTQGDGTGAGSRIIGIPLHGAVELEIPVTLLTEGATTNYEAGALVTAAAANDGKINLAADTELIVGRVTEVRTDSVVIYPINNGGAYSA
jgi:hypothetical protein